MSLGFTSYVDPGVYQQEVIVPSGLNIPAQPFAVCLVGTGSRNKRVTNEAVLRGIVKGESLTVGGSSGAHTATLTNRSDRAIDNTTIYKTLNGITTVVPDQYVTFRPAFVQGTVTATVDLSVATAMNAFALEIDGIEAITLVLLYSGTPGTPTAIGRQLTVTSTFSGTLGAAATMTEIAAAINSALSSTAGTALGFGSAYASCATVNGSNELVITSQAVNLDGSGKTNSDVQVFAPIAQSALSAIFGSPGASNRNAQSVVLLADVVWNASATWKADYVQLSSTSDPLTQTTNVNNIVSVGSSPGTTNFSQFSDWTLDTNQVSWSASTAAVVTGIAGTGGSGPGFTFDLSTNDDLLLGFDGELGQDSGITDILVQLVGLSNAPLGYVANPGGTAGSASTVDNIVANINAVLAAELGPRYLGVASRVTVANTYRVRLTSPKLGQASSSIYVKANPTTSAHTALFGGVVYPPAMGTGKTPAPGTLYYVTYEYTRPQTDYETPIQSFSVDAALAQVGSPSVSTAGYNPLAIAAQIAFRNGAQFIYTVQVDDSTAEGNPTRAEVDAALEGAGTITGTTEVIVVGEPGTRLDITTDMVAHLEEQCAPVERHYRRTFHGMAVNTPIGDSSVVDSYIGRSTRTLQVSPTSPGRGRMFLVAPPQQAGVTYDVTFEDGTGARIPLDSTYLAVAVAAARTALTSPAETLTRKTISGFNTDDITQPWKPAQRRAMAGKGVLVITYDAGRFIMLDALSTEGGGGGLNAFKVDSTSYQKDTLVTQVNQALDANIAGIVPFDLASFLIEIKLVIQAAISTAISNNAIGSYRDANGAIRAIDPRVDIRVVQNPNDATEFDFAYWFNLRYPALRLLGQYSVDNPFFSLASA